MTKTLGFVLAVATAMAPLRPVQAQSPAREEMVTVETSAEEDAPEVEVWPIAASVMPGILLHGSGAWVAGERQTAKRLLLIEGIGLGMVATGLAGLAVTGASRRFVAPLAVLTIGGGFGFIGSFFADVYGASTPTGRRGIPMLTPRLEASLLTSYRYDPRAATDAMLSPKVAATFGDWTFGAQAQLAPSDSTSRVRGDVRYRAFTESGPFHGFVDLQLAVTQLWLGEDDVATTSFELVVPMRYDLAHVGRTLRGGFAELALGGLISTVDFERVDSRTTDGALMARGTLGAYLGNGDGEITLYYDHRRDTLAGGLLGGGISAGFLGYVGTSATWFPTRNVGATATVEVGSALLAGLGVAVRFGEGR